MVEGGRKERETARDRDDRKYRKSKRSRNGRWCANRRADVSVSVTPAQPNTRNQRKEGRKENEREREEKGRAKREQSSDKSSFLVLKDLMVGN